MPIDWFVGPLTCRTCGRASAEGNNNCQTRLLGEGAGLRVGTVLEGVEFSSEDMLRTGYYTLQEPAPGARVILLETWDCSFCRDWDQWSLIAIEHREIVHMEAVELTRELLSRSHFISKTCHDEASRLAGEAAQRRTPEEVIAILREHLP